MKSTATARGCEKGQMNTGHLLLNGVAIASTLTVR